MLEFIVSFFAVTFSPDTLRLASVMHNFSPREVPMEVAYEHAIAARMAESPDVPATLLVSIAYSESRYNPYSVSHVRDGKRQWGIIKTDAPPPGVSGPYFCGVTQVMARSSWQKCMEYRDIFLAYSTAVRELTTWLKVPQCRPSEDRMLCALMGYGGGFPAIEANKSTYPARVLGRARAFARLTAPNI